MHSSSQVAQWMRRPTKSLVRHCLLIVGRVVYTNTVCSQCCTNGNFTVKSLPEHSAARSPHAHCFKLKIIGQPRVRLATFEIAILRFVCRSFLSSCFYDAVWFCHGFPLRAFLSVSMIPLWVAHSSLETVQNTRGSRFTLEMEKGDTEQ